MTIVCTAESCAYNVSGRCTAGRVVVHGNGDRPTCWNYIQAETITEKEG